MTDKVNEGSAAMLGSAAKCRPIGAYVHTPTYDDLTAEIARLRLTASEREALRVAVVEMRDHMVYGCARRYGVAETLQSLLDRLK